MEYYFESLKMRLQKNIPQPLHVAFEDPHQVCGAQLVNTCHPLNFKSYDFGYLGFPISPESPI